MLSSNIASRFSKCPLQPIGSRIVCQIENKNKGKVGSIYVPQSATELDSKLPQVGVVLATGPGRLSEGKRLSMAIKVGQKVLLPHFGGQVVKLNKTEYTIIPEEEVLAVFDK